MIKQDYKHDKIKWRKKQLQDEYARKTAWQGAVVILIILIALAFTGG